MIKQGKAFNEYARIILILMYGGIRSVGDSMVNTNSKASNVFTIKLIGLSCIMNHRAAPVTAITNVGLSAAELNITTESNTSAR